MGGFVSLAFADGLALVQGWHYGSRAEKLSRLAYELDFQGLRLDVLGTIREEIRDQVFVIMSSLDNLMVVAALMLSLGFGFVVEGTFPPKESEALADWTIESIGFSIDPLVVYALLCAMSLVCPFWCLIFTIRMRYEVDVIIRDHMKELKKQLVNVLQKKSMQAPDEAECQLQHEISAPLVDPISVRSAARFVCPGRLRRAIGACPQRRREDIEAAANSMANALAQHVGPFTIANETKSIEQAQILKWAEKDLLQRMRTYHFYMRAAHLFLWSGMLCAIFTCSILLGLYMKEQFPNTPLVWVTYSGIVGLNGLLAILFALWIWLAGPSPAPASGGHKRPSLEYGRSSTSPGGSFSAPLLDPTPRLSSGGCGGAESALLAQLWQQEAQVSLRVRDTASNVDTYRQVLFPLQQGGRGGRMARQDFALLEQRICAKFRGKDIDKVLHIKSLVRLKDRLEIVDGEDVAQLADCDELEVTFRAG